MSLAKRREFLMRERWFSLWDKVDVMDPATQEPVGHFQRKLFTLRTQYRLQDPLGDIQPLLNLGDELLGLSQLAVVHLEIGADGGRLDKPILAGQRLDAAHDAALLRQRRQGDFNFKEFFRTNTVFATGALRFFITGLPKPFCLGYPVKPFWLQLLMVWDESWKFA